MVVDRADYNNVSSFGGLIVPPIPHKISFARGIALRDADPLK